MSGYWWPWSTSWWWIYDQRWSKL